MINNSEFASRLKSIMDYHQLSASGFADKIQVPRSSISHLLSGRNKPSLDFVLKVVNVFKDVELYWLLNGKGSFPASSQPIAQQESIQKGNFSEQKDFREAVNEMTMDNEKQLEKIVFFYSDGSFREYQK